MNVRKDGGMKHNWENWRKTSLGEFCPFSYGKGLPEHLRKTGTVPVVSSAGISGWHDAAFVDRKGIVIGRKGTIGKLTLINEPFWPIDTAFYIYDEPDKRDFKFTYYLLQTVGLSKMNSDNAVPGLNRNNAHNCKIFVPPLPEQQAIASVLGTLDDKIELNQKMCKTLEAMAQALFKSWFIDFDPVRAKMEGCIPYGMDAETAALFPDKLVESELGLIPEGWEVKRLGDVVQVYGGGTPSTKEASFWHPEDNYWATPKDLSHISASVLLNTARKVSTQGLAKISSGLLPVNTLLMSSRAPIGYLAIAKIPTAINQGFIAIPPHDILSPSFLLLWCQQNMEFIKKKANGSTFMEISKSAFCPILMVYPPLNIVKAFSKFTDLLFDKIIENEYQSRSLEKLRDYLLPKLISGEVRVR
jgi:type I restriction enzyme S subunit